jgi:hypothetical protein
MYGEMKRGRGRCIIFRFTFYSRTEQREGMGQLLEYQAMPSLRDVAHDRWLCSKMYIYYITAAGNSISSQLGSSCQGNRYGTEKTGTKSHLPVHSSPASQVGRRVWPAL